MNQFASFSSSESSVHSLFSYNDPRLNRNFEQLVTQRGDLIPDLETDQNYYNSVFENIKEKLFIISESDDLEITGDEIKTYKEKYNIENNFAILENLKKQLSELYLKKIEHEVLLQEKRRMYSSFCENIRTCIQSINELSKEENTNDNQLRGLLNDRIDWYYNELDLDNLINTEYSLKKEFTFLKQSIKEFLKFAPTICSICMENEVSWFIDPCGHTMCSQCKLITDKTKKCHYCRVEKTKLNRLYL